MRVNFVFIAILIAAISACSTRVGYDRASAFVASPNSLNINNASADQLEKLPGIGRKTGETIIAFRNENGAFRRVEHLMLIRGISEERFVELRPHIRAE